MKKRLQNTSKAFIVLFISSFFACCISLIVVLLVLTRYQTFQIYGSSMSPTLKDGEIILMERNKEPKRGDIVLYKNSNNLLIHRVAGMPGDSIEFKNGKLLVNGQEESHKDYGDSNFEIDQTDSGQYFKEDEIYTIPVNKYLLLGDNRDASADSRHQGLIDSDEIKGVYLFSIFPF